MGLLSILDTCDGCGACCLTCGLPPVIRGWGEIPAALRPEIDAALAADPARAEQGGPCLWYDPRSRRCRHYEDRPTVCREFDLGSFSCHELRIQAGLATADERAAHDARSRSDPTYF